MLDANLADRARKTAPSVRSRRGTRGSGQEARLHRPAPGEFQSRPCRPMVRPQRPSPRYPQAALRRSAARDAGASLRLRHLRRADERQRQGRIRPHARPSGSACALKEKQAVPGHLPRRANAGRPSRRQSRLPSRGAGRDRLLPASHHRRRARRSGISRSTSTSGTAKASSWRAVRGCSPHRNGAFPNQAFGYGPAAVGVQFHPEITYAQVHRWTGHNPQRLAMKGACARPNTSTATSRTAPRCKPGSTAFSAAGSRGDWSNRPRRHHRPHVRRSAPSARLAPAATRRLNPR